MNTIFRIVSHIKNSVNKSMFIIVPFIFKLINYSWNEMLIWVALGQRHMCCKFELLYFSNTHQIVEDVVYQYFQDQACSL